MSKRARVNVKIGEKEVFFFYSLACGHYLMEKYGSPVKADKAFNFAILKNDGENLIIQDKKLVPKGDDEWTADDLMTIRNYVHALTISWANENKTDPVDIFEESDEELPSILLSIGYALGLAMPKGDGTEDPQKP